MSKSIPIIESADPRWKDLYHLGGVALIVLAFSTVFANVAFFIWPYDPGFVPTAEVFAALQEDRLRGLMSLDLMFILGLLSQCCLY